MLALVKMLDLDLKCNKPHIATQGWSAEQLRRATHPGRLATIVGRLDRSDRMQAQLDSSCLDAMNYGSRWRRHRIRLAEGGTRKYEDLLTRGSTRVWQARHSNPF